MATFSPTRLKSFFRCPSRYMFDLSATEPPDDKSYFDLGTAVHSMVERYITALWETGDDMNAEIGQNIITSIGSDLDPSLWAEFMEICYGFIERHIITPRPVIGGLETMMAIGRDHKPCDYDDPTALLRGRVDRWWLEDGRLLISDIKTDRRPMNRDQVENDLQLLCYAYMGWMHHIEDVESVRVQLDYVRWADYEQPYLISGVFPVERLEKMAPFLDARARELESYLSGEVPPPCKPGADHDNCKLYGGCPHLLKCRHWAGYEPPEIITTMDQAAKLQAWVACNKAEVNKQDRIVKSFIAENGPVEGYGYKSSMSASRRYKYDGDKVWKAMEERGKTFADFAQVCTVQAGSIPKSIKEAVQAELDSEPETRITVKKTTKAT